MKRKINYLKAIVICHGKSELQMSSFIKSNLKIRIEAVADKNGGKSIQVKSLNRFFNSMNFKDKKNFCAKYGNDLPKGKIPKNFKIFIIMDVDDCNQEEKHRFIQKSMFKNHELYNYIVPIYNDPKLEDVLTGSKIPYDKTKGKNEQYIKIFPTDKKYIKSDTIQIEEFKNKLLPNKQTNMDEFIDFCLKISEV